MDNKIKLSVERHKLSDGSYVSDVMIRWATGYVSVSATDEKHAERIYNEISDAASIDVTTFPE